MGKTKQGQWKWTLNLIGLSLITFLIEYVSRLSGIDLFLRFHCESVPLHTTSPMKPVQTGSFLPAGFVPTQRRTCSHAPATYPDWSWRIVCDWLISHCFCLCGLSVDDILSVLGSIVGRKHPSPTQSRQLKQSLPMMAVVLHLLTSQVCVCVRSCYIYLFASYFGFLSPQGWDNLRGEKKNIVGTYLVVQ